MKRAICLIKNAPHYRHSSFVAGVRAAGYEICQSIPHPDKGDLLVIWNRSGTGAALADHFESRGAMVLVAENGYLGTEFCGSRWYALSRSRHNGVGSFPVGGSERWDSLGITLEPWRGDGGETVVLPQRGIGSVGVAMPRYWTDRTVRNLGRCRIRPHPGKLKAKPLADDLAKASAVVTWGSGAALKALAMGIPCYYGLRGWIGAQASREIERFDNGPLRDTAARLAMFRRLAWAMAPLEEIESGEAIRRYTDAAI